MVILQKLLELLEPFKIKNVTKIWFLSHRLYQLSNLLHQVRKVL